MLTDRTCARAPVTAGEAMTNPPPPQGQPWRPAPPPPHPGYRRPGPPPQSNSKRALTVAGIAFACLAIFGIGVAVVSTGSNSDTNVNDAVTAIEYATPPTGTSGDLEFVVQKVATGYTKIGSNTAGGEYISVTVKVTNVGKSAARFDPDAPYVFDAQERMYSADSKVNGRMDEELNPGMSITRNVVYDVPPGTKPTIFSASAGFGVPFARIALPAQG